MALHKYCFLPCISISKSFPNILISLSSLQGTLLNPTRDLWTKRQGSLHIHQHQRIWAGHPQQALASERRRKGGICQALVLSNFETSLCRHSEGPWFGLGNVPWWGCCSALWRSFYVWCFLWLSALFPQGTSQFPLSSLAISELNVEDTSSLGTTQLSQSTHFPLQVHSPEILYSPEDCQIPCPLQFNSVLKGASLPIWFQSFPHAGKHP